MYPEIIFPAGTKAIPAAFAALVAGKVLLERDGFYGVADKKLPGAGWRGLHINYNHSPRSQS